MLTAFALVGVLHAAPLSFTQGEFLGWTADGETYAWTNEGDNLAVNESRKTVGWREPTSAHSDEFVLEFGPLGGKRRGPGPDVEKFAQWQQAHPLTKATTLAGVKTSVKVDGKEASTFGGAGKAVKVELIAEKGKLRAKGKSIIADYVGKKVRKAKVVAYPDPTGRRVVFVIDFEAGEGEPATSEMVEVAF